MPRGGKPAHVGADLGEDPPGTEGVDPGNGDQQRDGGAKGRDVGVCDLAQSKREVGNDLRDGDISGMAKDRLCTPRAS